MSKKHRYNLRKRKQDENQPDADDVYMQIEDDKDIYDEEDLEEPHPSEKSKEKDLGMVFDEESGSEDGLDDAESSASVQVGESSDSDAVDEQSLIDDFGNQSDKGDFGNQSDGDAMDISSDSEQDSENIDGSDEVKDTPMKGLVKAALDKAIKNIAHRSASSYNAADEEDDYISVVDEIKMSGLQDAVKDVANEIVKDEPTVMKIVSIPMTLADRKEILQLYEIYREMIPGTLEHYELRKRLVAMLNQLAKVGLNERIRVEEAISKIPKVNPVNSIFEMKKHIIGLQTDDGNKGALLEMVREYTESEHIMSNNTVNIKERLNMALALPYMKRSPPLLSKELTPRSLNKLCVHIRKVLDDELYGMEKVKDKLISVIVNKCTNPGSRMCVALKGEPGIGKTDICRAFAKAIGRPFELIALGSVTDSTSLTGSMNWYVGSSPGLVLQALRRAQVCDPVILYDEIDKMMEKDRTVENAMKDITDYTKNTQFRDTFLPELLHDISEMWTFFTLNNDTKLDPILKNRLTIISVPTYSFEELVIITTEYLLPRALVNYGMPKEMYTLTRDGCTAVIDAAGDKSVRQIDASLREILSRINTLRGVTLSDGTLGKLKLSYSCASVIKGEKVTIDRKVVQELATLESKGTWMSLYT